MTITKIPSAGLEDVVTAGSSGSASQIPVVTINSKGQVTGLGSAALDLSTKANTSGSNASGTWPISITGNSNYANSAGSAGSAGSVPWTGVTGRPDPVTGGTGTVGLGFGANCGNCSPTGVGMARSGANVYLYGINCNCACACDCAGG